MKKLFNKITNSEYFQVVIFIAVIGLIVGIGAHFVLERNLFGKSKNLTTPFLWILYTICWITVIIEVILLVTVNKEKYSTWEIDCSLKTRKKVNKLKGGEWYVIIWSVIIGPLVGCLISRGIENIGSFLLPIYVWLLIPAIVFTNYLCPPNPSGDPKDTPFEKKSTGILGA